MNRRFIHSNNLIFDLGMNNAEDTAYYLKKGYKVVSVEADPLFIEKAQVQFTEELNKGLLHLYQVAIWTTYDRLPFHISKKNAHWSSLDINWASRDNGETETIEVTCIPLAHLFSLHGVPSHLKIDIEGADELVIDQLQAFAYLPAYISIEDCRFGFRYLEKLKALGYSQFKLSNQATVTDLNDPLIAHHFPAGSSGPLGEQVPGPWIVGGNIEQVYADQVRTRDNERRSPAGIWWDIHASAPQNLFI
jgi:FkbM family methyltransferase